MHNQDIDTEVENSCWNVYKNKPTTSDHSCWSDADKFCITWSSKSKSLSPRHGDSFGTYYPARVYSKVTSPPSTNFDVVFRRCHFEDYLSLTLCVKRLNLKLSWPTFFAVAFLERKGQLICSLKRPSDRDALISFNTVHRLRLLQNYVDSMSILDRTTGILKRPAFWGITNVSKHHNRGCIKRCAYIQWLDIEI